MSRAGWKTAAGLLVATAACQADRAPRESLAAPAQAVERQKAAEAGTAKTTEPGTAGANVAAMVASRKLIRTAQITLEVESWDAATTRLDALVESAGGYLAGTQVGADGDQRRGTITVRVPADRFTAVLTALRALGTVESETVSAQDVTKAYTDLETRLVVKRETADRMRQILKDRTAGLADVLTVERELARITEEIEHLEGERRFYDQQVALSTLTCILHEPRPLVRRGVLAQLSEALHDSTLIMSRSLAVLVYLVAFLSPWLVVLLVAWQVVRFLRRRRAAKPPSA